MIFRLLSASAPMRTQSLAFFGARNLECEWKAKRISNPEFVDDDSVYAFDELCFIGFDLALKGGTILSHEGHEGRRRHEIIWSDVMASISETNGVVESLMAVARGEIKKRQFQISNHAQLEVEEEGCLSCKEGHHPFTKDPCVFKAKLASTTVKVHAMKKLKEALN